ncbi:MAG: acyl-CoA dehydrogenase [Candidatus Eisenbacteria bacterium]|uniref:Acyl-CoA dehydrogenase n=1 Tax=Eiseniibacteriota bacterium TaxID=2212470 RepID=A0A948RXI8_UNCEI|nr:acyl-CoA dehydrogenase [Candidatus Eisenbacteria bacterium]MBU1947117.1 acyl-CoA dehydrogenase [Candidatus Eisenbacteria bacterium]MBU2691363.1 acyl-CoA dehydrogenase [Candidatus Eisenbacteria bacterium]
MDLTWSDEQRMMIESIRDFCEDRLGPIAREIDEKGKTPPEILREMSDLGLMSMPIPHEYDGLGLDSLTICAVIEEISRVCASVAITISVHNSVGAYPILLFGTEEQKRLYLPKMCREWLGAFALTEPNAGSDAAGITTQARKEGDAYILNGSKMFVTNGSIGQLLLVIARTDPDPASRHKGISAFLVPADSPGISVASAGEKMGIRGSDTAVVHLDNVRVAADHLLGGEGEGFKIAMASLDNGRLGVGAQAVGIAQAALDEAVKYAKEREAFGRPLAEKQAIQFMVAEMETSLQAARLLIHRAAWMKDENRPYSKEAAMAKLFAAEMVQSVTHDAIQIHGGYGYMKEYPVERYARDARITEIYEGASEIQRIVIARSLLKED